MEKSRELGGQLYVRTFRGVTNAAELVELAGGVVEETDAEARQFARCVLMDLGNVVSEFHIKSALFKAVLAAIPDSGVRGKAASFRTNVLFNMSQTGKIVDAIAQFNVAATSTSIAVVGWVDSAAALQEYQHLASNVQGAEFDPALLLSDPEFTGDDKKQRIIKLYKIPPAEMEVSSLDDCVVTRLAVKEIM